MPSHTDIILSSLDCKYTSTLGLSIGIYSWLNFSSNLIFRIQKRGTKQLINVRVVFIGYQIPPFIDQAARLFSARNFIHWAEAFWTVHAPAGKFKSPSEFIFVTSFERLRGYYFITQYTKRLLNFAKFKVECSPTFPSQYICSYS